MGDDTQAASIFDRATTTRDEMARWARQRGGRPAVDRSAGDGGASLALVFPGSSDDDLERVDWDEFAERLEEAGLAFAYTTDADAAADGWGLVDRDRLPLEAEGDEAGGDAPAEAADDRELGGPRSEPRAREAADEANLDAHRDEPPFNS